MSDPLAGWIETSVSELFALDSGTAPLGFRPGDLSGPVQVYGANGAIGSSQTDNFGPGYLVGRVGAVGSITRVDGRVWASDNTLTATPRPSRCDFRFAEHLLRFLNPARLSTMTAQPLITQANLGKLSASVPGDTTEQSRIAVVLDKVDEAIAKTAAVIAKLKQVRAGMLHDLLTRGLDENGQVRDPVAHPEQFQDSPLGRIPREWSISGVWQLARNCDARRIPLKQADRDNRPGIYPYYGASGVIDHIDDYLFEGEFVLLAEDGENLRSRELPLAFIARGKFWVNNHAHILEPLEGADIRFLQRILELQDYIPWLIGSAQPKLTQAGIEAIQIKIPPSAEQIRIADALERIDIQLAVESELLRKFRELKAGLMTDLLTGRVRVPENIIDGGGHT